MITIPDDVTPDDLFGKTAILAGQNWLIKSKVLDYADWMSYGTFPWEIMNEQEPMSFQVTAHQTVIDQGHHRWAAAQLAGIQIPVTIELRHDWPDSIPFAYEWKDVT